MFTKNECFHIFDLLDKIMISLNEIPWESITLPIFKYWYDLLLFENMLCGISMGYNPSKNFMSELNSVDQKFYRFFFRGLIHFKKLNVKIVDANINAQESENSIVSFKENLLMPVIERINNCETVQDLIDGSPNAECPICLDVTFTESTDFVFRVGCNHLVCLSCTQLAVKSNNRLVKNIYIFSFD